MISSNTVDISFSSAGEISTEDAGKLKEWGVKVDSGGIRVAGDVTGQRRRIVAVGASSLTVGYRWNDVIDKVPVNSRTVCPAALGLLLRCGFVPCPLSVYENIYQLGIGDRMCVDIHSGSVELDWRYPFDPDPETETEAWDDSEFESRLVEAVRKSLQQGPACLLLSAGKDSMALLHAAASVRPPDLECLTYAAGYRETEHSIAGRAAQSLGFSHTVVQPDSGLQLKLLLEFAENAAHPSFDCALPSTLLCAYRAKAFAHSLVDGLGNDKYMYVTPSTRELIFIRAAVGGLMGWFWGRFVPISRSDYLNYIAFSLGAMQTERWFPGTRVGTQWIERLGGDWREAREIVRNIDKRVRSYDVFQRATVAKARYPDYSAAMEKTRNAAESFGLAAEFPFCDRDLIAYYSSVNRQQKMSPKDKQGKLAFKKWVQQYAHTSEYYKQKGSFRFDSRRFFAEEGEQISKRLAHCVPSLGKNGAERLVSTAKSSYVASQQVYLIMACATWLSGLAEEQRQKLSSETVVR